ncbi:hypothetical protein KL905_002756 [Ogataea polymorpha]|nr:hypothetical protein KL937_004845 [Ogataea polymorpha]KAG7917808.1 hypothetical protein KL927_002551 [Ogataea polymorpha]KAG7921991.1 hypothetical protein KL905_002756 [Ogataea polymorpha]KAG7931887.1 hypothetical protein KL904_004928 [Ogataea polymorpha]
MKLVECVADQRARFLACVLSGPGRSEVRILSFESEEFKSSIELGSDEKIERVKWLQNKDTSYLGVLLSTNEILIYSPLSKEVVNKISTVSALIDFTDGPGQDVWGYDRKNMSLRKFGLFENRVVDSRPWTTDKQCQYLQYLHSKLAIASSALYVFDPYEIGDVEEEVKIAAPKAHQSHITSVIICEEEPDLLALAREDDPLVQIVSLSSSKVLSSLKCLSPVKSLALLQDFTLAAVTEDGVIEIFHQVFGKKSRKQLASNLHLKPNTAVKFVNLVSRKDHFVVSWFDGYDVRTTAFEIENLSQEGEIIVDVGHEDDSGSDEEYDVEKNESDEEDLVEFFREDVTELYSLILESLTNTDQLATILSQNQDNAKSIMFLLKDQETTDLFKQLTLKIADDSQNSQGLGTWLRWLLISKGNLISKDADSVGLLKLLQSSLTENIRLLPSLLTLQGRLALLQSQLKLRNDMMSKGNEAHNEVSFVENSVFLDGENDDLEYQEEVEEDNYEEDED